jgi:hypothetical protein
LTYSNNYLKDIDKYYGIDKDDIPEPEEALIPPDEEEEG